MLVELLALAALGWPDPPAAPPPPGQRRLHGRIYEQSPTYGQTHAIAGRFGGRSPTPKLATTPPRRRPSFGLKINPLFGFKPDDVSITAWQWP